MRGTSHRPLTFLFFPTMNIRISLSLLAALLSVLPVLGGTVPLSEAPMAVFDDCESVTNAPRWEVAEVAGLQSCRVTGFGLNLKSAVGRRE